MAQSFINSITNTGTTSLYYNYQRTSDAMWMYGVELAPNQTKTFVFYENCFATVDVNAPVNVISSGVYPPPPQPTEAPHLYFQHQRHPQQNNINIMVFLH